MSYIETAEMYRTEVSVLHIWSEEDLNDAIERKTQFYVPIDLVGSLRAQLVEVDFAKKVGVFEVTEEDEREYLTRCFEVPLVRVGVQFSVEPPEFGIPCKGA